MMRARCWLYAAQRVTSSAHGASSYACARTQCSWSYPGNTRSVCCPARTKRWWLLAAESTRWPMISLIDQAVGAGRHAITACGSAASHGATSSVVDRSACAYGGTWSMGMKAGGAGGLTTPGLAARVARSPRVRSDRRGRRRVGRLERQLERPSRRHRVPLREQLGATLTDSSELVVGEHRRLRGEIVLPVVRGGLVVEVVRRPASARCALGVEKSDDELGRIGVCRNAASWPRRAEVGEIPPARDEPVEPERVLEDGLDREVRQVVAGEEHRLR